jgi:hypothetical protein
MRWFSLLTVALTASAMHAAFATTTSQAPEGAWKTAQLSVARLGISTASAGSIAIFAGGSSKVGDSGEWNSMAIDAHLTVLVCAWAGVQLEPQRLHCFARLMFISDALVFNATDVFDSATGKWSTAELSVARSGASAVSVGTLAIFAGGATYNWGRSNATDVFDSATGKWSTAELSVARSSMAAVSVGRFAIFAGGMDIFGRAF